MVIKKVAITGGAGFLGSHVASELLKNNYQVNIIDDFSNGKMKHLEDICDHPMVNIFKGDIRKIEDVRKAFADCNIVIHLAVLDLRQSIKEPMLVNQVIVNGTLNCLSVALENHIELFLNCSSSEVYGTAKYIPMDEKHPLGPETPYAAAKVAQDMYTYCFGRTYGLKWVTFRPFNMYGPNSHWQGYRGELIPKMIVRAMNKEPLVIFGDGEQTRDFVYVEEAAKAIRILLERKDIRNQSFNFCSQKETSVFKIAELICNKFSLDPNKYIVKQTARPGDVMQHLGCNTKFKEVLGFVPEINIEEGLARTIKWFMTLNNKPEELLNSEVLRNWE